jgi:predicted transcriptional regulator
MVAFVTTSLKLDSETKARLQRLANARRRPAHWLIREAAEQYIDREEARKRLRHDALAAWVDYDSTGQHATAAESDAWLARLEAGEDVAAPICRG